MRYTQLIEKNFQVLSTSGDEVLCICPWHDDKSGHLYVNGVKGLYLCMSCGAKGSFESKTGQTKWQLPPVDVADVRERLRRVTATKQPQRYHPEGWLRQYAVPHDYWTAQRGFSQATVARYGLGYDVFTDRVTLPLRDMHGQILGVTMRRLDDGKPKYSHPKGFPIGRHLYGAWLLKGVKTVAITEGQVDSIQCDSARIPAVSTMGARITRDQVKVLQRLGVQKVVMMYDNDHAGLRGTASAYEMLQGSGISFTAGWYRDYWVSRDDEGLLRPVKDPDQLNADRLRKMYHSAVNILDWISRTGFTG